MSHLSSLLKNQELLDIFAAKQEYSGQTDKYGRFLYQYSKNKTVLEPLVSDYLKKEGMTIDWPENHKFAACLTHDIDAVYPTWKYLLYTSAKFLAKGSFQMGFNRLFSKIRNKDDSNPYLNFVEILNLESKYDAKSTFYFKATTKDIEDWIYNIDDFANELQLITDLGGDVGLHGGFFSYDNPEELIKEKNLLDKALGRKTIGIRMHYLRFKVPETWRLLAQLGFKYDSTFGYSDMPGFRNGMCHPFKPYDLKTESQIDIVELPLIIMDTSLFKMPPNKAWAIIRRLIIEVEKNHGLITILWHNNTFDNVFFGDWAKLYEKILRLLKDMNAWITSAEEVYGNVSSLI